MIKELLLRCDCGCNTILVWHEEKIRISSKYFTYETTQQVFCPNEKALSDE
jgi:hypothetical protein